MSHSILITQCLQNDFVQPLGPYDALPNLLHVGFDEARRLMGEHPAEGPLALTMKWAYQQPADKLTIIHIRDWHDPGDLFQAGHLGKFGSHCLRDTEGADFAFPVSNPDRETIIVNAIGLNDFLGTSLNDHLEGFAGQTVRVGLVGVWTEAKIIFLAYDLRSRFPDMQLAVCSALTASSSRATHFMALDQMERILGVKVFNSIGEFTNFLSESQVDIPLPAPSHKDWPKITIEGVDHVSDTDMSLIRYLFRDCREVHLRELTGGFSGNLVLGSESVDMNGHQQVPHVVKIGPDGPIGKERTSFERVEGVLGNNAPRIVEFADSDGRGALKYRYAAMGGGFSTTFQKLYSAGLPREKTEYYLKTVFSEQLGRFYKAAILEKANLLEYYWFKPDFAERVREKVKKVIGGPADGETLRLPTGQEFPNPYPFYKRDLEGLLPLATGSGYFSFIHGDLNGANIIIDAHDNVWLIDFFHTQRGHILKDLIKLENDILYIFTPVHNVEDLKEAILLTDRLLLVEDLGRPLPDVETTGLANTGMKRAYETIRFLRSLYPSLIHDDRNPLQLMIGQLRYAAHTLSFDESNEWQKLWALYTAGRCSALIRKRLKERGPLRIDWVDHKYTGAGRLGLTILPGRKDYSRSMVDDLVELKAQGVTHVVTLLTPNEFVLYGVENILDDLKETGLESRHFPILNQSVCSFPEICELVEWLDDKLTRGASIMVHCVGGLGRSGLVVACYLVSKGLSADSAIEEVRRARSPRAIESTVQEAFVREFASSDPCSEGKK